mgnify:CR=1 FL=1
MITISIKESIIIGSITIICAILIQVIVKAFGDEDIQTSNLFYKHRKSLLFYIILFIVGIIISIFIKYIEYNEWYCQKICTGIDCKVLCTLPLNLFTNLLITA